MNCKRLLLNSLVFLLLLNFSLAAENVSIDRQGALNLISDAEGYLKEVSDAELYSDSIRDQILEAKRVFQQVEYASILRGEVNSSPEEISVAKSALSLINWKELSYADVLPFVVRSKEIRDKTFLLYDYLSIEQKKLAGPISNQTTDYFFLARESFYSGRLNETEDYLDQFKNSYENDVFSRSATRSIVFQAKAFFIKYWWQLILIVALVFFIFYYFNRKIAIKRLRKKIRDYRFEKVALINLIRKAQSERYKEGKISSLTYNIRIKMYQNKLQEIKKDLPVLEDKLKRLRN